jgi:hypothetical protein
MSNVIVEEVKGSELPRRWAEKLGAQPDQSFTVTIQSQEERRAAVQELERIMEAIGREARDRGFTPEALSEILGTDMKPLM